MTMNDISESIVSDSSDEEGVSKKKTVVKFAEVEAEKEDALKDQERSKQELLQKIGRLTAMLKETQDQVLVEKNKRKKKEKSLVKLAKELKKRNVARESEQDHVEELEEKTKWLEHHWVLSQKELDQEKALHDKLRKESQSEYDQIVKEERLKLERQTLDHETRLKELQSTNATQCEALGREAMTAKLEADRLHKELLALGEDVPRHLLTTSSDSHDEESVLDTKLIVVLVALLAILANFSGKISTVYSMDGFTKSGLCAPVMPGTIFDDNRYGTFLAPWWAPMPMKHQAYGLVCNSSSTSHQPKWAAVRWDRDGKQNKLTVLEYGPYKTSSGTFQEVFKKSVSKVQIHGQQMVLWKYRNDPKQETVAFDWTFTK